MTHPVRNLKEEARTGGPSRKKARRPKGASAQHLQELCFLFLVFAGDLLNHPDALVRDAAANLSGNLRVYLGGLDG